MINGAIAQKLQTLDEVLTELRSLGQISAVQLQEDWRDRRAAERDLQILVEIVIDICQRLISLAGQAPAATGADAVRRCIQLGVLSDNDAYRDMVRFRNFIVHRYEQIDVEILAAVINRRLSDLSSSEMKCWPMSEATKLSAGAIDWQRIDHVWENTPGLVAAWAFGSSQDGDIGPDSDIDIAVFFVSAPSLDAQLALLGDLQDVLHFEDIDLVVLNNANPILRFEAISGRSLFCRDPERCAGFVSLSAREYEDEMALWQRALG